MFFKGKKKRITKSRSKTFPRKHLLRQYSFVTGFAQQYVIVESIHC